MFDLCSVHKRFQQLDPEAVLRNKNAQLDKATVMNLQELRVGRRGKGVVCGIQQSRITWFTAISSGSILKHMWRCITFPRLPFMLMPTEQKGTFKSVSWHRNQKGTGYFKWQTKLLLNQLKTHEINGVLLLCNSSLIYCWLQGLGLIYNGVRRPRQIRGPKIWANVPPKELCWRHRVCHLGAIVVTWAARWGLGVGRI